MIMKTVAVAVAVVLERGVTNSKRCIPLLVLVLVLLLLFLFLLFLFIIILVSSSIATHFIDHGVGKGMLHIHRVDIIEPTIDQECNTTLSSSSYLCLRQCTTSRISGRRSLWRLSLCSSSVSISSSVVLLRFCSFLDGGGGCCSCFLWLLWWWWWWFVLAGCGGGLFSSLHLRFRLSAHYAYPHPQNQ